MVTLAIDTSAAVAVALVTADGTTLATQSVNERRRHAEQLTPMIEEVLAAAGLTSADVTGIAVGTGPAPFTGLRIGLVTAQTFGLALDVPVWGVPSIDVLAAQAVDELRLHPGDEVFAVSDARRREVYWARYLVVGPQAAVVRVAGPAVDKAADAITAWLRSDAEMPGARMVIVGEGAVLYPGALPLTTGAPRVPDPAMLARIAVARAKAGVEQPTTPLYLRRPDIHEKQPKQ
ncbi:MAG: tRNA (adenosine(37)-N6)-threonylcarbamoyltransferase complex dimerization subunit type 1 TsaB [Promicromonosporaceae bacterium]|nr:tRNA (adenosine(37)-N6)-threonylcarbamoyltransferase complex dimerization subunit type 1 TsaB [Promicromonosporaceae bacterium]